jgi:transcriptional regulator with XRE-family HTH domain
MSPTKKASHVARRRNDRNSIGKTVSRLRRQQNLTQEDLAGRAAAIGWEISRDAVKRIERGEREVTDIELRLLAKALRVPAAVLLE